MELASTLLATVHDAKAARPGVSRQNGTHGAAAIVSRIEQTVEPRIHLATQPRIARLVELFFSQQRHLGLERLQLRLTL